MVFELLVQHIIANNAINENLTGFGPAYAYINAASGGLLSYLVFFGLFVLFAFIMLLRDVEPEAAGLVSAIILVLISSLAQGITVNGLSFGTPFAPFLFGGIAFVCFLLIAFRGVTKSY